MPKRPAIASWDPCVSCSKGDTSTAFAVDGTAEFHAAALIRAAGLPESEAFELTRPLGPGDHLGTYRLCRSCAARMGTPVADAQLSALPGYSEEQMFGGGR